MCGNHKQQYYRDPNEDGSENGNGEPTSSRSREFPNWRTRELMQIAIKIEKWLEFGDFDSIPRKTMKSDTQIRIVHRLSPKWIRCNADWEDQKCIPQAIPRVRIWVWVWLRVRVLGTCLGGKKMAFWLNLWFFWTVWKDQETSFSDILQKSWKSKTRLIPMLRTFCATICSIMLSRVVALSFIWALTQLARLSTMSAYNRLPDRVWAGSIRGGEIVIIQIKRIWRIGSSKS
jgi:hypothetical protein